MEILIGLTTQVDVPGDVSGLAWLGRDLLAVSHAQGGAVLYRVERGGLQLSQAWSRLHSAPATALAAHGTTTAATAGQADQTSRCPHCTKILLRYIIQPIYL